MILASLASKLPPRDKLLRIGGYGGFALAALLVSLYLTFPAEAVGQRLAHEITKQTGGRVAVTFGDVGLYRLTGFEAEQVKLRMVGDDPIEVTIDALRVRLKILPLLLLHLAASAEIELGNGDIEASVGPGAEADTYDVALDVDDVDLAKPPVLPALLHMPFTGVVGGSVEATWSADPRKAAGKASLTVKDASLGPAEVSMGMMGPLTIPPTLLGQLDLALDMKSGRMRLASFQQKGGDIAAKATASIALRPKAKDSNVDACFEVKPTEQYFSKNPTMRSAFELASTPGAQLRKDDNGFLHVSLGGTLGSVKRRGQLCRGGGGAGAPPSHGGGDEE